MKMEHLILVEDTDTQVIAESQIDKRIIQDFKDCGAIRRESKAPIDVRILGPFADIAFFLTSECDWRIGVDGQGNNILVPIKW